MRSTLTWASSARVPGQRAAFQVRWRSQSERKNGRRTQHPEFVFPDPIIRHSNRPDDAFAQIRFAAHVVNHFSGNRIEEHGVDREIPSVERLLRRSSR